MNRTVIITGSNSGIGKAAAKKFASDGDTVILAVRSVEKGEKARQEIEEVSAGRGRAEVMEVDVSSSESVRSFCDSFRSRYKRLDLLIHNAAYFSHGEKEYQMSRDGIELTFATNLFGPWLMTRWLKDSLAASEDPRILTACTTNIKHFFDPKREIEMENLRGEHKNSRPYNVYRLYGDSKMALLVLSFYWAESLLKEGVHVHSVMINNVRQEWTSLMKFKSWYRIAAVLQNLVADPPRVIADIYHHICTSEEFGTVSGKLVNHKKEMVEPSKLRGEEGFQAVLKEIRSGRTYPAYADRPDVRRKVVELCRQWETELL